MSWIVFAVLVTFIALLTPTAIAYLNGPARDNFNHIILFIILGMLFFFPVAFADIVILQELHSNGVAPSPTTEDCQAYTDVHDFEEMTDCEISGAIIPTIIAEGILIYWIGYVAGINMRRLVGRE